MVRSMYLNEPSTKTRKLHIRTLKWHLNIFSNFYTLSTYVRDLHVIAKPYMSLTVPQLFAAT